MVYLWMYIYCVAKGIVWSLARLESDVIYFIWVKEKVGTMPDSIKTSFRQTRTSNHYQHMLHRNLSGRYRLLL
jgi:hypothetical protein